MTLVDFDTCYRIVYLRKLHSVTLTYFFGGKFKICISLKWQELAQKYVGDIFRI